MARRPDILTAAAICVCLIASPFPVRGSPPCPPPPQPSAGGTAVRTRALISALIPSVYLEVNATTVRQRRRQSALSAPDRPRAPLGEWELDSDHRADWEVGLLWDPVRLIRRSHRAARWHDGLRRPLPPSTSLCPRLRIEEEATRGSLEDRLDRAVARQKRRSLDNRFD